MLSKTTLSPLTYLLALLSLVSCLFSVSFNEIYQDGEWANAQWLGQDLVTLLLALPFLLISFYWGVKQGREKWLLVYSGILFYFVYTYSFFMFAAKLTVFYLFHLPIFGLSVIALVIALMDVFGSKSELSFRGSRLKGAIITYLLLISAMITILWISDIIAHLSDPRHQSDTPDGEAPLIIYSLDLAIVIPLMVTAAILFYRNRQEGYRLNGIILTKTSTLGFALMAMAASMYFQDLNPDYFLILLWCIIGIIGTSLTVLYLRRLCIENNTG